MLYYKYAVLSYIILILLSACTSNSLPNDIQRENLQGKVKSIIETSYKVLGNEKQWKKGSKHDFGEKGYIYNPIGMLEQIHIFEGNHLKGKIINTFDKSNHLSESKTFNEREIIIERVEGSFDKDKKISLRKLYDFKGDLQGTIEIIEDEKGNITQRLAKNKGEEITYLRVFEYNAENKLSKQSSYNDKLKESLHYIILYKKYDKQGNIILSEYQNKKTKEVSIRSYEYQYDSSGNWTQKIEFKNGKARILIERELEYY